MTIKNPLLRVLLLTWPFRHFLKELWSYPAAVVSRIRYKQVYRRVLTTPFANSLVTKTVKREDPFIVSRLGAVESRICYEYLFKSGRYSSVTLKQCHANAGIFPANSSQINTVASLYLDALSNVDVLGFWNCYGQPQTINAIAQSVELVPLQSLEPWRVGDSKSHPWSMALRGKKVLVVHPFADTIRQQYDVLHKLFKTPVICPNFELITLRPPVTHCGMSDGFSSWSAALSQLQDNVFDLEFDVALLGCGAYGLPLANSIKKQGSQVFHLGGALQLLFGIIGRRWELDPDIASEINEYWVRPSDAETPTSSYLVDGGSYW